MTPPPEAHQHRHSDTGRQWLDVTLGVGAIAISLFSAVMTLQHGRAMEKMVDQNARMVQASTWPYVTIADSNGDAAGHRLYKIMVLNNGVGPARIESVQLSLAGKSVTDVFDLAARVAKQDGEAGPAKVMGSGIGGVIPARQSVAILTVQGPTSPDALIAAFNRTRARIDVRVCYCSIFEDCWTTNSNDPAPRQVKACNRDVGLQLT